ncbi:CAZyme family GH18 [Penicillium sp. IBT 18751x]|nr:CAZyme family GH18 [Penicillium sp. IBT 18751x]
MTDYLSYFIFMTYDLCGQWEFGYATEGNLRSHINKNSPVMITKAGVPANKVLVGIPSYDRNFGLNFGGFTDWAVDLEQWSLGLDPDSEEAKELQLADLPKRCPADNWPDSLDKLQSDIDSIDIEYASASYDKYFSYHSEWIKDNTNDSLEKFMWVDGRKYMDYKLTMDKADGGSGNCACTEMTVIQGQLGQGVVTITYTVRDEDGFYNTIQNDYGVLKDWKSVIDAAVPNITALQTAMLGSFTEMRLGVMDTSGADIATAYSPPSFMIADTTEQMKNITKIGKEQKKAGDIEKVSFILDIISVANVARAALVVDHASNVVLSVYDIIKDPYSAPFDIFGLPMGADASVVGKCSKATSTKAAAFWNAMTEGTLKSFSKEVWANGKIVQDIVKACKA